MAEYKADLVLGGEKKKKFKLFVDASIEKDTIIMNPEDYTEFIEPQVKPTPAPASE